MVNCNVVIACMVAMVAAFAAAGAMAMTSSTIRYWEESVATSQFPERLKTMVSPLNTYQELHYESMLKNHEEPAGLCSSAKIYCDANDYEKFIPEKFCLVYHKLRSQPKAEAAIPKGLFFKESLLIQRPNGEVVIDLNNYRAAAPPTRFLPRGLVRLLEEAKVATWSLLGIPASSRLAKVATETAASCATAGDNTLTGEDAFCVSSVEDIVDHLTSTALKIGASNTWRLLDIPGDYTAPARLLHAELVADTGAGGSPYLSCHSKTSPYATYFCHHVENTRVYKVTLQSLQSNPSAHVVSVVALCHMDTSEWHPEHVAFKDLKSSPGKTEACHLTNADSLVFVTTK